MTNTLSGADRVTGVGCGVRRRIAECFTSAGMGIAVVARTQRLEVISKMGRKGQTQARNRVKSKTLDVRKLRRYKLRCKIEQRTPGCKTSGE